MRYKSETGIIPGLPVKPVLMRIKKRKGANDMPKKIIIGFQTSEEIKKEAIKAAKNYKIDGVASPMTLSGFCRVAVLKFLAEEIKR